MTTKQKLYKEYLELKNEYYTLKGETDKVRILTDEYLNGYSFTHKAQTSTIDELRRDIENIQHSINAVKFDIAREEYFKTPEGKAYKEKYENEYNAFAEHRKELHLSTQTHLTELIQSYLGKKWIVSNVGRWMRICYVKGYDADGKPLNNSWQDFSVDYELENGKDVFRMNYPTCGSWDLLADEDMRNYLAGLGKFGTDKEFLNTFMTAIKDFSLKNEDILFKISDVKDKLINPDAVKVL